MVTTTPQQIKPDYLTQPQPHQLPEKGFLRLWQIIGDKDKGAPALIPVGRTSFLNGVKSGKYPKPVKLGERTTAWKVQDIRNLIDSMGGVQ